MSMKIIALTSNEKSITVYLEDGSQQTFPTDLRETSNIIKHVTEAMAKGNQITLDAAKHDAGIIQMNVFQVVQEKTNGVVKFFRTLRSALTGSENLTPKEQLVLLEKVSLPLRVVPEDVADEVIVAVVQEPEAKEPVIVPEAQNLVAHVAAAAQKDATTENITNLLKRVGAVAKHRRHSAEDLLNFLRKNDMPITRDGSIIAYKRLVKKQDDKLGVHYVDSYTGNVTQWLGSRVEVDEKLVDPDRNRECSQGLHVGRRSYMRSFNGNTIVLVLVAPEDVIAVPTDYGRAKMRACAYHILAEVSAAGFKTLCADMALDGESEALAIGAIVAGKYSQPTSVVNIGGQRGANLTITRNGETHTLGVASPAKPVAIEEKKDNTKVDPATNSPKAIKEALKQAQESQKPVAATQGTSEMTDAQKLAQSRWKEVKAGTLSKAALAKLCGTSPRSLDRWEQKFNF